MNLRRTAYKLQTALCAKGRYIRINQFQSYSPKAERMVTKFVLAEKQTIENCGIKKEKYVNILETYSMADVVKKLARIYGDM